MDKEARTFLYVAVGGYAVSALLALMQRDYVGLVVPTLIGLSLLGSSYSLARSGKGQHPPILLFAAALAGVMLVVARIVLLFEE